MIVPKAPQFKRMVQYVGMPLLLLFIWDVLIVVFYQLLHWHWISTPAVPLTLYGSVIGLILGFRNNAAYSRWWDARTLWGQIVNNSRSLARQVCATLGTKEADEDHLDMQRKIVYYQIAYVHALRQQLRELDPLEVVRPFLSNDECLALKKERNVPLALQRSIGLMLRDARDAGWIDVLVWQAIDRNLDDLADAQGGAERIKNTPMPKQYDYFPALFVQIYCLLLPIGLVDSLGWITPVGSTVVGFMFLALNKIGLDLQNPFDNKVFDVPLTSITRTIEINLRQLLGETDLPAAEAPNRGVLW